jgi:hypothetical protein
MCMSLRSGHGFTYDNSGGCQARISKCDLQFGEDGRSSTSEALSVVASHITLLRSYNGKVKIVKIQACR